MSTTRDPWTQRRALVICGISAVALLIGAIALLIWVIDMPPASVADGGDAERGPGVAAIARDDKRFTLRLGQGFRFKDGAVVVADDIEGPDIVFKYVAPQVGGMALRYNPISQQVETGLEPTLTAPLPLLLAAHVNAFDHKPDIARTTTGDIATYANQAPIASTTRYLLLMNSAGDQYLLTLDELEAPDGRYDDWRIGFAYEPVNLPLGLAGGQINQRLPGRLIFRDWYRTKMIVRVDLTTGREEPIVDGIMPTTVGDRLLGYGDASSAYVIRDSAGRTLHTIRFNEQVLGPVLSPDGTRLAASVYRPGPDTMIGGLSLPGPPVLAVAVFDVAGREVVAFPGYDDAVWTPDGNLIATGALFDPGLFEIDPSTRNVRAVDPSVSSPFQPNVSPDGKTIAFITGERVWLIDRDGKNLRQLYQHGLTQQRPVFSPDSTKIAVVICNTMAYDVTGEVFVIDVTTQEITPLRTNTGSTLVPDPSTRLNWIR